MKTKIFYDIADYQTIKFFNNKSLVDGFGKSFKSMTLDTVKGFLNDSKKSRFSL